MLEHIGRAIGIIAAIAVMILLAPCWFVRGFNAGAKDEWQKRRDHRGDDREI